MSKKTKSELRISTFTDKQILFTTPQDDTATLTEASWERIRRNPQYQKVCDGIEFNDAGIVELSWYAYGHPENQNVLEKSNQAQSLFGITQLLNPKKTYEELLPVIHLVGIEPVPIEATASKLEGPQRFLEDGKYITLKINITQKDKHILESLKLYLDYYRQFTGKDSGRNHTAKETEFYYKVWDERLSLTSFSEIALKFGITAEAARKQFRKAYELILGEKYDKASVPEIIDDYLSRKRDFKKLLQHSDIKQQHKIAQNEDAVKIREMTPDNSIDGDPEVYSLLKDIHKEFCQKCSDLKCKETFESGDLKVLKDCPRAITYLQS